MSKRDFLDNLRVARNLFVHGSVSTDSRYLDAAAVTQALTRAAIWLTPCSVKGFRADDFQELDSAQRGALADAVQEFERVAKQVPPDAPATERQFNEGKGALKRSCRSWPTTFLATKRPLKSGLLLQPPISRPGS